MIVSVANSHCRVTSCKPAELRWLSTYLSFPDANARFSRWGDGKIHLLSDATMLFPTGYLSAVCKEAKTAGVRVELLDVRQRPVKALKEPMLDWLRDYQLEAMVEGRAHERGVFHHVTGAGKTEVQIALAELYPCTWLILTHRKDIMVQIAKRFADRTGEEVGIIGEGKCSIRRVTVAMFQSVFEALRSRKKSPVRELAEHVQGVMVDEAHVIPANTFYRVVMSLKTAYYRYGFSGTPFARGDKKSIYSWGAIGPTIHRITADRLIKEGVLAKPKILLATVRQHLPNASTWADAYREGIVESDHRNSVVQQLTEGATKPCLLFVKEIAHGKTLERRLRSAGTAVEFVWGSHTTAVRQAAIRRLVHGDVDVLVCNVIFQEGIDIPELQSVVIASGGKSAIMVLQDVGRGMRRRNRKGEVTKTEFEVYDIADRGCGCSSASKHRSCKWLEKHTRDRLKAYAVEKYAVTENQSYVRIDKGSPSS